MIEHFEAAHRVLRDRVPSDDLVSIEDSPNVIYAIWPDGRLAYTNRAFREFAEVNGAASLLSTWGVGRNVFDAMSGQVAEFYREHWAAVLASGEPGQHTYECSSREEFRLFHMTSHPLPGGLGLVLVVNSLAHVRAHDRVARQAIEVRYRDADGLILQCANCRRVRDTESQGAWHWIPDWVSKPPDLTSHGICSICIGVYYSPRFLGHDTARKATRKR